MSDIASMLQPVKAAPFEDAADIARMLATLPEESRLSMMTNAAKAWNVEWLKAGLAAGMLDVEGFAPAAVHPDPDAGVNGTAQALWLRRCEAMMSIMRNVEYTAESKTNGTPSTLRFHPSPDVEALAGDIIAHVSHGYASFKAEAPKADHQRTETALSAAMCLAAMMGRADLLARLLETGPEAAMALVSDSLIGERFQQLTRDRAEEALCATPLMHAVVFGQMECSKLLLPHSGVDCLMFDSSSEEEGHRRFGMLRALEVFHFGDDVSTLTPVFQHLAAQHDATPAVDPYDSYEHDGLARTGLAATIEAGLAQMDPDALNPGVLAAYLEARIFEQGEDPSEAIVAAVENDRPSVIAGLAHVIDWATIRTDLMNYPALPAAIEKGRSSGLVTLLNEAHKAEKQKEIHGAFLTDRGEIRSSLASKLLGHQSNEKILMRLLAGGFDPDQKIELTDGKMSFADLAANRSDPNSSLVRSYMTQRAALAAIAKVDLAGSASSKPGKAHQK